MLKQPITKDGVEIGYFDENRNEIYYDTQEYRIQQLEDKVADLEAQIASLNGNP